MSKVIERTRLQITLVDGEKEDGSEKLATLTFPRISESASDEALQEVGTLLGGLQEKPVKAIYRLDNSLLA